MSKFKMACDKEIQTVICSSQELVFFECVDNRKQKVGGMKLAFADTLFYLSSYYPSSALCK